MDKTIMLLILGVSLGGVLSLNALSIRTLRLISFADEVPQVQEETYRDHQYLIFHRNFGVDVVHNPDCKRCAEVHSNQNNTNSKPQKQGQSNGPYIFMPTATVQAK